MRSADEAFRILGLCASAPGHPARVQQLREEMRAFTSWDELIDEAEQDGLEPLLRAHLAAAAIEVPAHASDRLRLRWMQHAHAHAVRTREAGLLLDAFAHARVPVVILKGLALAHLVYPDPALRPMRDIDLLVPTADLGRASEVLARCGFINAGPQLPPDHHHVRAVSKIAGGLAVTIELHHGLFQPTPFLRQMTFDEVADRAQQFDFAGRAALTLSPEDMLWHVYAHAFAINVTRPAIRLISVADLTILTERWIDRIDWNLVARRYGRAMRALPFLDALTPWSDEVRGRLMPPAVRAATDVGRIAARFSWSAPGLEVLWPPGWWLGVRYGVAGPLDTLRSRAFTHPASLAMCGLRWSGRVLRETLQL